MNKVIFVAQTLKQIEFHKKKIPTGEVVITLSKMQ